MKKITLKTFEELEPFVAIEYLSYRDILGQEVEVKEVLFSQKINFYGVMLGGKKRYSVKTRTGTEYLIYPEHIKKTI